MFEVGSWGRERKGFRIPSCWAALIMLADMSRKSDMNNVARKIEYPYLRLERRGGGGQWREKVLFWPLQWSLMGSLGIL